MERPIICGEIWSPQCLWLMLDKRGRVGSDMCIILRVD